MAFRLRRTLSCDHENCPAEYTAVCKNNTELEYYAEKHGWYIKSESGNSYIGFTNPTHLCPEHKEETK